MDAIHPTLKALADPTRLAILDRLVGGPQRVTDLAEPFAMSLPAVSKHLRVLERAGLIRRVRRGREHHLILDPEPLRRVHGWVGRFEAFWQERLTTLERFLGELDEEPDA